MLILLLVLRGIQLSLRLNDPFMKLSAFGISLSLGLQAAVNLAMTMGLLPTKGIPLPFISYGGSSLMVSLVMVGLLLSLSRHASPSRASR
ncbi:MAG: hypothetical protein KatS3mg115_0550 [Candidatus Poribacteria bacterium]|nr:MAG: hypothetical protein KatS3mg115_0550 [Candidatus Poribacteria bacterium]